MHDICKKFPVTTAEFEQLEVKFGQLAQYAAWQLIKKNSRNNHTDEQEDIAQELRISLIRAGSYYKRQVYIENCLELCAKYAKDKLMVQLVAALQNLWENKTRHGANRQKFGPHQEIMLEKLTQKLVPKWSRPSPRESLKIDTKFSTYCKAITWNAQKSMGKKITREKSFRASQVSLSQYDYLVSNN
jgi:hypothetical protein